MKKELDNNYWISDDKSLLQLEVIHNYLKGAYWCEGIPKDIPYSQSCGVSTCNAVRSLSFMSWTPAGDESNKRHVYPKVTESCVITIIII